MDVGSRDPRDRLEFSAAALEHSVMSKHTQVMQSREIKEKKEPSGRETRKKGGDGDGRVQ